MTRTLMSPTPSATFVTVATFQSFSLFSTRVVGRFTLNSTRLIGRFTLNSTRLICRFTLSPTHSLG
ncbi:MAG: hypothetical protein KAI97_04635, partial [Gemmatimonadetes bacterium]|nr:hypothetical protein [Gemmatimonadota bacterium]